MEKALIVGLGNPSRDGTRHNFGIEAVRLFVERLQEQGKLVSDWKPDAKFEAEIASVAVPGRQVTCFFPTTSMNDSGRAVAAYLNFYKLPADTMLVAHDELELPLGEIRLDRGGPARGHNGVRSLHQHLGTADFARLRLGIGRPAGGEIAAQYVLQTFADQERPLRQQALAVAAQEILQFTARQLPE